MIEQGVALYMQLLDPYVSDAGKARAMHTSGADPSIKESATPEQHEEGGVIHVS